MPFKSKSQQAYLFMHNPQVADEFANATPKAAYKKLPKHVKAKTKKRAKRQTPKPKAY